MTLFGGLIVWQVNKQDTVTILSMKAELLALSQTVKKAIFIHQLLEAMKLRFENEDERLSIKCDNTQILRLVKESQAKLIIKL